MKRLFLLLALFFLLFVQALLHSTIPDWPADNTPTISVYVDSTVDGVYSDLPFIWQPGIDIAGGGSESVQSMNVASPATINKWSSEVGWDQGVAHVFILLNRENLDFYAPYLDSIIKSSGKTVIKFGGIHDSFLDSAWAGCFDLKEPGGDYPDSTCIWDFKGQGGASYKIQQESWAYPPENGKWREWGFNIRDAIKYIVATNADSVSRETLFGDTNKRACLGYGNNPNIYFGLMYGAYGTDPFQWMGSFAQFRKLWFWTDVAANWVEDNIDMDPDVGGIQGPDIKLGGFSTTMSKELTPNMHRRVESQGDTLLYFVADSTINIWNEDGFMDNVFMYIDSIGGHENFVWSDFQFRHPLPWELSDPLYYATFDTLQKRLTDNNFSLDTVYIGGNMTHGHFTVNGEVNSIGQAIENSNDQGMVEVQSEIDAALIPARIADQRAVGQEWQIREYIQDAHIENDVHPLYDNFWGALGIGTLGLGPAHVPLKKPSWNVMEMIAQLGPKELVTDSDAKKMWRKKMTINGVASADLDGSGDIESIHVLFWSYISPTIIDGVSPDNNVEYDTLYSAITDTVGNDSISVEVKLYDIKKSAIEDDIIVTRWVMDKYTSNSFYYRDEICWALDYPEMIIIGPSQDPDTLWTPCAKHTAYGDTAWGDSSYTMAQINSWISTDSSWSNLYTDSISVDLEIVSVDTFLSVDTDVTLTFDILPYSVTLLKIVQTDIFWEE